MSLSSSLPCGPSAARLIGLAALVPAFSGAVTEARAPGAAASPRQEARVPAAPAPEAGATRWMRAPLHFEEGPGGFVSRGAGFRLCVDGRGADFLLRSGETGAARLRMDLEGGNAAARLTAERRLPGRVHFLRGSNPRGWRANVPTYGRVRAAGVYPGIDALYYGNQQELEYDFVVAPGADPDHIRLRFPGAVRVVPQDSGDLRLEVPGGAVTQRRPVAYQEVDGRRREVPVRFRTAGGEVRFALGRYDRARPLVIDPIVRYASYLGGGLDDRAWGVAVDSAGRTYVTGSTWSNDFPSVGGVQDSRTGGTDAFVTCFSPDGSDLLWSTYLGGTGYEVGRSLQVRPNGIYLAGETGSSNFPLPPGGGGRAGGEDGFFVRLSLDGSEMLAGTLFGGRYEEEVRGLSVDGLGNAYVVGKTHSNNFLPLAGGFNQQRQGTRDGFLVSFRPDAGPRFGTYIGGTKEDEAWGVTVDSAGRVLVAGSTRSLDFPTSTGAYQAADPHPGGVSTGWDGFVVAFSSGTSAPLYSTYLGRGKEDSLAGICAIGQTAVVVGETQSLDFATPGAALTARTGGAWAARLSADGRGLLWSSYLPAASARAVALGPSGDLYVTGRSSEGYENAFLSRMRATGASLVYTLGLGGSRSDVAHAIAVGPQEHVFLAGETWSSDAWPTADAYQPNSGGGMDAFLVRVAPLLPAAPAALSARWDPALPLVTLGWQDRSLDEIAFRVERSDNGAAFRQIAALGVNARSFTDRGVIRGVQYRYRVRAQNNEGYSAYSNIATAF